MGRAWKVATMSGVDNPLRHNCAIRAPKYCCFSACHPWVSLVNCRYFEFCIGGCIWLRKLFMLYSYFSISFTKKINLRFREEELFENFDPPILATHHLDLFIPIRSLSRHVARAASRQCKNDERKTNLSQKVKRGHDDA